MCRPQPASGQLLLARRTAGTEHTPTQTHTDKHASTDLHTHTHTHTQSDCHKLSHSLNHTPTLAAVAGGGR